MSIWDERYAKQEFIYGTKPNEFFKDAISQFPIQNKLLFAAEGEGRNAVYAAKQGFSVTAFDLSQKGKEKAELLAKQNNVTINYQVGNLPSLPLTQQQFDAAVLIYAHFPETIRQTFHQIIGDLITPSGYIILEGFSTSHLPLRTANPAVGGPSKAEMLFTKQMIESDFKSFESLVLKEEKIQLNEGLLHNGTGSVIRYIGKKL